LAGVPKDILFRWEKNGNIIRSKPNYKERNVDAERKLLETHKSCIQKVKVKGNCPLFLFSANGVDRVPIKNKLESYSEAVKNSGGTLNSISKSAFSLLNVLHNSQTVNQKKNRKVVAHGCVSKPLNSDIDDECMVSITHWLVDSCSKEVATQIQEARVQRDKYKALLLAVSGGDLSTAAKIAEEENLMHLSILLASGPEARSDIFQEIMAWRKSGNSPSIQENLSRTYRLIAGDLGLEENMYKNPSKGRVTFDWRRRMIMKFMYSKFLKNHNTLSAAIVQYQEDVSKGVAPFPSAHHGNESVESLLFRLLRLGSQPSMPSSGLCLSSIVDPLGYTEDPKNFSLSFHLTSCITAMFDSPSLNPEEENAILDGYAFQLQSLGLWQWAVYVILCVLSDKIPGPSFWRVQRAKSLVLQNYNDDDDNLKHRDFLQDLGVPFSWFEEALCYRSSTTGNTFAYINHNLNLDVDKAIKVLERTLVPNILFLNGEKQRSILHLVEFLSSSVGDKSLVNATSTFFAINEDIRRLETSSRELIEDAIPKLLEACDGVEQIFSSYKASEEKLLDNNLDIVPETYLVPMGSFLAEALNQTSRFKLQILALKEGMSTTSTSSQMLNLVKSQGCSDVKIGNRENICRWLM